MVKSSQGDLDGALADCNKVIELNPFVAQAYSIRGGVNRARLDLDAALAQYNKAIELKPDLGRRLRVTAGPVETNERPDLAGAVLDFTKSIQLNPSARPAYRARGCLRLTT